MVLGLQSIIKRNKQTNNQTNKKAKNIKRNKQITKKNIEDGFKGSCLWSGLIYKVRTLNMWCGKRLAFGKGFVCNKTNMKKQQQQINKTKNKKERNNN